MRTWYLSLCGMDVQSVEVHVSIYDLDAYFDSGRTYMVAVPLGPPPVVADANKVLSMCGCELMATLRMELSGALAEYHALVSWNLVCWLSACNMMSAGAISMVVLCKGCLWRSPMVTLLQFTEVITGQLE